LIMLVVVARLVGMYLRTTRRRNRDGSVVRYVQLARALHERGVWGVLDTMESASALGG
jgi:hypothetical protein